MRRVGGLWVRVIAFENLMRAARQAALGKRRTAAVARFLERAEPEVLALQRELASGTWRPGKSFVFEIHDPKTRTIACAPFRDRVVHHALIDVLEPVLDRRMVFESFACRRGKGTHAALLHARRMVRRHAWFLKLDVRRCFPSIGHDAALESVARIVKDRAVLALFDRIVRAGGSDPASGRGLPIGSLTSQWLANLVLDRLDHHVKEVLRVPGYVRYMDDFALFADDKSFLWEKHAEVRAFLAARLALELKDQATCLAPAHEGLPFLGWSVRPAHVRIRRENLRRSRARLARRTWEHRAGFVAADDLASSARSIVEHLRQGSTLALRRKLFAGLVDAEGEMVDLRSAAPRWEQVATPRATA